GIPRVQRPDLLPVQRQQPVRQALCRRVQRQHAEHERAVRPDRRAACLYRDAGGRLLGCIDDRPSPPPARADRGWGPRPNMGAVASDRGGPSFRARSFYGGAMNHKPLVEKAREAARGAYAPYSRFRVGCAIESVDGKVALGANMENACYRLGTCAESAALAAAAQAFGLERIARIAVAGGHFGTDGALAGAAIVTPCGGCRQAILEAAQLA